MNSRQRRKLRRFSERSDEKQREALKSIGKGDGVDFLWIEEANALSFDDYQVLMTRLRGRAAGWRQALLSCNPDHENHWINRSSLWNRAK